MSVAKPTAQLAMLASAAMLSSGLLAARQATASCGDYVVVGDYDRPSRPVLQSPASMDSLSRLSLDLLTGAGFASLNNYAAAQHLTPHEPQRVPGCYGPNCGSAPVPPAVPVSLRGETTEQWAVFPAASRLAHVPSWSCVGDGPVRLAAGHPAAIEHPPR